MEKQEDRLRFMMRLHELTREQTAEIAGVSTVTVHKWLNGAHMSDHHAMALGKRFMCDWQWLKFGTSTVPHSIAIQLCESNRTGKPIDAQLVNVFQGDDTGMYALVKLKDC